MSWRFKEIKGRWRVQINKGTGRKGQMQSNSTSRLQPLLKGPRCLVICSRSHVSNLSTTSPSPAVLAVLHPMVKTFKSKDNFPWKDKGVRGPDLSPNLTFLSLVNMLILPGVGRIMPFSLKDVYVITIRIYEYIRIRGTGELRLQVELFANQMTLK